MSTVYPARVLIYSHDSFGLGHLRRCRTLAQAIVSRYPNASVLILSGSPIVGSFEFPNRVDFVRVPGVIKHAGAWYEVNQRACRSDHIMQVPRRVRVSVVPLHR